LLYNAVDLAVVGQFCGDQSLAAVGSTGSLTNLIINLFMGVSIGANVAVARAIGQKNASKVEKLVHTAIIFSVLAGLFFNDFRYFHSQNLVGTDGNDGRFAGFGYALFADLFRRYDFQYVV
ncbi:MAG TPA: hypothetical protein IAD46_03805, partial [Candidatus Pelethenecus faecipullorum]|nr:hypothetical protein [Candidatus Pelethenecus faecipullorum]